MDFYYLVMCKCMSTTVRVNGTVQFTFFLVMRLNITIVTSCDSLIVILVTLIFSSLKLENELKKDVRNVARIKYGFVEIVVILFLLIQDVIIPSDFAYTTTSA